MIEPKLTPDQKKLVDEYTEVRAKCMAWKPAVNPDAARYAELQKELLSWFEGEKGDERKAPALLKGTRFTVPVAARENKRTIIQIPKLLKRLGTKWIHENFKPTLKSIETVLTPVEMKKFVTEENSGPRTLGEPVSAVATKTA